MGEKNLIIHFTDKFEKLYSIIESNSFRLSYCKEEFTIKKDEKKLIVSKAVHPMVCFSEKNLKNLNNEIITYGKYGISFNKTWAINNGIKPVRYLEINSPQAYELAKLLIFRRKLAKYKSKNKIRLKIMKVKCFTKNAVAYNSFLKKEFEFKKENEWRFVPTKKQINGGYISESRSKYISNRISYNKRLKNHPLKFNINDVKILFVNSNEEIEILNSNFKLQLSKIKIRNWKD